MTQFTLDTKIAETSLAVTSYQFGQETLTLRLVDDSRYLWLLLIPCQPDITEWHHLSNPMRHHMIDTASAIADIMRDKTGADKMNIATIGNIVSQFHLHMIARHRHDESWPNPVWGRGPALPYGKDEADKLITDIRHWLRDLLP